MAAKYAQDEINGLDYIVILGEDQNGAMPSQDYCKAYAEQNNIDPAKMVIDMSWEVLFAKVDSGQAGGIGLPWDGVINGDGMTYVWNATVPSPTSADAAVDALLAE